MNRLTRLRCNACSMIARIIALCIALLATSMAWAAPAFQAAGTAQSATGTATVPWPTHQPGDIALLFVESTGGQAATLSTAAGFVQVTNSPQNTGTTTNGTRITVFWARATSSAMASPVVADPGDHVYAQILTYRGVIATGNPWDVTGGGVKATASTSVTVSGVTTTVANTLVVQAVARDNDSAAAAFSAQTNANLTGITEQSDAGTTSGNGGGFGVWDGAKATAGATGNTTATVTSSINAFLTIALKPEVPTLGNVSALCDSTTQVEVQFSTTVTSASAQNIANYSLDGGAAVTAAVLDGAGQVVTLTVSGMNPGQGYTLTVNNITGTYGGVLAASSQAHFFTEGGYLSGLLGTYYGQNGTSGAFFTGTSVSQTDNQVNFDWGASAPGPAGIGADNFSVRWTGFVTASVTGNYTFETNSDDGVRLYVNGVLVIDNWTDHSATTNDSAAIALTAGTRVAVTMEYYERGGNAVAQLSWSGPTTGGFQFIPRASLSHFCGVLGPVAFYKLDENVWSGSGAVTDSSGNGNNGTASGGAVPVSAKVCNGVQLNGSSRYIQVPGLSGMLNATASLAFWIKTTQVGSDTGWQAPGVTGVELTGGTDDIFWGWIDASGRIGVSVGDTYTTKSTVAINNGVWRHVVLTRDSVAGTYKIYIDGALNVSGAIATGTIGTAFTSLGRIEDTGGTIDYLNGQLDEIRIYDRVVTDSEVTTIFNETRPCVSFVDHYALVGSTSGVTCDVSAVRVIAHDATHTAVSPAAGTVLNLTTSP
ncbi:MAG TPA: PA14 domain-containing protein, partial [Burkholderiales bacterium]|nr:PA14 domain-containing protein [Burkholderiales bacterium]